MGFIAVGLVVGLLINVVGPKAMALPRVLIEAALDRGELPPGTSRT